MPPFDDPKFIGDSWIIYDGCHGEPLVFNGRVFYVGDLIKVQGRGNVFENETPQWIGAEHV